MIDSNKCGATRSDRAASRRASAHQITRARRSALGALAFFYCACAGAPPARSDQQDCKPWEADSNDALLEYSGLRLGTDLNALTDPRELWEKAPKARYFDGLNITTYVVDARKRGHPVFIVETVTCGNGRELIAGIKSGELVLRQTPIADWLRTQKSDLERSGVEKVTELVKERDISLWGVKARAEARGPDGTADYMVLRRGCRKDPDNSTMCGLSDWDVHRLRSKELAR